ncbi:hypothetical protein L484_014549 [Morus notabilis]|uniref:Uncharacterized protein n=1 Tax=Morus notabilis TaxID=981085 RepID=W9RIA3_9ROSA|nr:hypothetical protein L484_014549 [Morus notabilis]
MNSSAEKLLLLFLLFGLGVYMATSSTLLPHGDKKSSSLYIFDCKGVLRKSTAIEEGGFGCENLEAGEHKPVPSRSLRSLRISPPSPIKNRAKTNFAPAAPSPLIA